MIKLLKKLIFWSAIREQIILLSHRRTASLCRSLIDEAKLFPDAFTVTPKKDFGNKRIIGSIGRRATNHLYYLLLLKFASILLIGFAKEPIMKLSDSLMIISRNILIFRNLLLNIGSITPRPFSQIC